MPRNCYFLYSHTVQRILISRCLLGEMCRWDAKLLDYDITNLIDGYEPVAICPEMEGGLPCPRPKAEIKDGEGADILDGKCHVVDSHGRQITNNFLSGAQAVLNLALKYDIKRAILKDKSPSCGVNLIFRDGRLVKGMGVTAALLKRNGIEVTGYGA